MKVTPMALSGVLLFEPPFYKDARGAFAELFVESRYAKAGITAPFVQDNWSYSEYGVLRGLHIQPNFPQGKLITVMQGHIWDVVLDIDPNSDYYGQHVVVELFGAQDAGKLQQLWVPSGYAHGFCVLSSTANVLYKCTQNYHPEDEGGVLWSDPDLQIEWPVGHPKVSQRDAQLPTLKQFNAQA